MTIMTNFTAADMPGAKAVAKPASKKAGSFKAPVKAAPEPVVETVEEETE
jgi:hypothetical protein